MLKISTLLSRPHGIQQLGIRSLQQLIECTVHFCRMTGRLLCDQQACLNGHQAGTQCLCDVLNVFAHGV